MLKLTLKKQSSLPGSSADVSRYSYHFPFYCGRAADRWRDSMVVFDTVLEAQIILRSSA